MGDDPKKHIGRVREGARDRAMPQEDESIAAGGHCAPPSTDRTVPPGLRGLGWLHQLMAALVQGSWEVGLFCCHLYPLLCVQTSS